MKAYKKNDIEVIVTPSYAADLGVDIHHFDGMVLTLESIDMTQKEWRGDYKDARIVSLDTIEENPIISDKLIQYLASKESAPTNVVSFARYKEKRNHVARR